MHYIDSVNFEKTYKIIKKYGFPDYDLRDWKHDSLRQGIVTMTTHFDYSSKKGKNCWQNSSTRQKISVNLSKLIIRNSCLNI